MPEEPSSGIQHVADSESAARVAGPEARDLTIKALFGILWEQRRLVSVITVALTLASGITGFFMPRSYNASIVVAPVSDDPTGNMGGLGSLLSQVGGLASLAGISAPGGDKKAEYVAVLQSEALTAQYIREKNLLPVLYPKYWDPVRKGWKTQDPKKKPTLWKANQFFKKKVRKVVENSKTGLVTLTIEWKDPQVAATWANDLIRKTNDYLRASAITESERNIAYLHEQAAKTAVVEVRAAIYSLLEAEVKKVMLARGRNEYALKVIDPAVPPERPSSPGTLMWLLAGCFGGFFIAVLIAFGRAVARGS